MDGCTTHEYHCKSRGRFIYPSWLPGWSILWQNRGMDIQIITEPSKCPDVDAESCYQITQWKPDIPPDCVQVAITKPTIPPITHQVFTYGSHLLLNDEFSYYDTSLRATVAWCMAHRPRDRPTMLEIQDIFRRALVQVYQGDDDDDRSSIRELLETPPPSPSSVPSQD